MNKLDMKSNNQIIDKLKVIAQLFPNVLTEGNGDININFDVLKQELVDYIVDEKSEKYELTWPGKRLAKQTANEPTTNTLLPQRSKSVSFNDTKNIYIEGDNLEVLKILQESYLNKIKCIYIDPPYNTGNDFIYNDSFVSDEKEELIKSGQFDENLYKLISNSTSSGRFHSDWLSMMFSRLSLARNLLKNDGVIFISIDDNEQENLKKMCDEIFGETNFIGQLIHQRAKGGGQAKYIVRGHDYILVYAKQLNPELTLKRKKVVQQKTYEINGKLYLKDDDVVRKVFGKYDKNLNDRRCFYEELVEYKGEKKKQEIDEKIKSGEYFLEENNYGMHTICRYVPLEVAFSKLYSIITVMSEEGKKELEDIDLPYFDYPKPTELLKKLINAVTFDCDDEIVLDFFSGSSSTADAVMQINAEENKKLRYIMVQIPEKTAIDSKAYEAGYKTICDIAQERIRRVSHKIEAVNKVNIDTGFRVYKLDSSNMKDVYYKPSEIGQMNLMEFLSNIKDDRTSEDLLTQVILDLGLTLDLKIEEKNILNNNVYYVGDNSLIACFDDRIDIKIVDEICKCLPERVVFKDFSFKTDKDRINIEERIKELSPNTEVNVI